MQQNQKKLNQCEYCRALIGGSNPMGVCKDCTEVDEKLFDKARNHLGFGQQISPEELAEKSGVDLKHIERWAHVGRFGRA